MQRERPKFNAIHSLCKPAVLFKQIGVLSIFFITILQMADGQERGMDRVPQVRYDAITQQAAESVQGHPKLVALLVAEDYSRDVDRPNWGSLGELQGVWQDLARMQRRLQQLGFGKIIVLASNQSPGSRRTVSLRALPGVSGEPAGEVTLEFAGPATRQAMLIQAEVIRNYLSQHRNVPDNNGGQVPPLFVLYYSGHGTIQTRGERQIHVLPIADNVRGEATGFLIRDLTDLVGADSQDRGEAGNGSSLVVLDCCQAGLGLSQAGKRSGKAESDLLESEIMHAIRAGRQGRFLIGASLGDEAAREDSKGGYFTSAFCAALLPDEMGREYPNTELLSLNHVALTVDKRLLGDGRQALSRYASTELQWDNYVLFLNPHFTGPQRQVHLWVTTEPPMAQVEGRGTAGFVPLETLGFTQEEKNQGNRRYEVPSDWVGHTLVLRAVPTDNASDRIRYEASPEKEVNLAIDQERPMAVLVLKTVISDTGDIGKNMENQIFRLMNSAHKQTNALEKYRDLEAAYQLAQNLDAPITTSLNQQLNDLRPEAGQVYLQQLIASTQSLSAQHRYRMAYEQLRQIRADGPKLRAFNVSSENVDRHIQAAHTKVLATWRLWSVQQCREAAEDRLRQVDQYIKAGQPHLAYQKAVEAKFLTEQTAVRKDLAQQATEQMVRAQEQTANDLFNQRVALETVVSREVYGLLLELSKGDDIMSRGLQNTLKTRYDLPPDSLEARMETAREQFKRQHAKWFPPKREAGELFRDCAECPEMVVVPSGSFTMGSPNSEDSRDDDEGPRHRVHIGYPLAVGIYEVTFSEWEACVNAGGCGGYRPNDRGWGRGNRPVINVSWKDAQSYVCWLSQRTGHRYSLQSESEWEYVARAGTTTPFYFGSTISTDQANYDGDYTYGTGHKGLYRVTTVPVGSFSANAWGVHDMHGNVWEWVEDCHNYSYVGAPTDGSAWESGDCAKRVLRGGSWDYEPRVLRSASRIRNSTEIRFIDYGFRVARRF